MKFTESQLEQSVISLLEQQEIPHSSVIKLDWEECLGRSGRRKKNKF
ncbi:hypothetical protein L1282_001458 [Chryseobacterium sp. HSC-36S06]|nr:hypothetical protein [Chryseobacterium sp. HSC-36S06]